MNMDFFKNIRIKRIALSVSAVALIGASGHKAAQYAQTAWGDHGLVLIIAGAVAAFYALHTAFNDKASKTARGWSAAAVLVLGLLEGGAIMQGNIEKAALAVENDYAQAIVKWESEKSAIDNRYKSEQQAWEADRQKAEKDQGNARKALSAELETIKAALAENAASQRSTKASDKEGNVTPAYKALLDQQVALLARSQGINTELAKSLKLDSKPEKPIYPVEPIKEPVKLSSVEYAQAFAFPVLAILLMYLRGLKEEENAALVELGDIREQADAITTQLNADISNIKMQIAAILASAENQSDETIQQIRHASDAELTGIQHQFSQIQQAANAAIRNADVAARAISQRTVNEIEVSLNKSMAPAVALLQDVKDASESCAKNITKTELAIARAIDIQSTLNKNAIDIQSAHIGMSIECRLNESRVENKEISQDDILILLKNERIETNEEGKITDEKLMELTGWGIRRAKKAKEMAFDQGLLDREPHGKGFAYFYPRSQKTAAMLPTNVVPLTARNV